jgi:cystathionine gamma-synthase
MHSATKQMSGHSDLLAGALITRNEQVFEKLQGIRTLTGGVSSAFDSYLLLRGLRTLHLRQERSSHNALEIAKRLEKHPKVSQVNYPGLAAHPQSDLIAKQMTGFGSLISIEIIGGVDDADQVCSRTAIWSHSTSLGGVESQLERRRKWPNEPVKVPENLIRLSVGIEDIEDLWLDLDQALNSI